MKFSRNWLQSYIKEPLPSDEMIEDTLNKKAFEVEGIETFTVDQISKSDTVYDIKVLPNRHGDALSHYYMAKEMCALLNLSLLEIKSPKVREGENKIDRDNNINTNNFNNNFIKIKIEDEKACSVFEAVHIDGVDNRASPKWMKDRLEAIGQRSINAIVDITNYVQFAINKPMHAYDARDVSGDFIIRYAKKGEKLIALDGAELDLDTETLVIADTGDRNIQSKVLGLAGIKGGKYSGIKSDTTSIILESANFDPILIRKTSKKYNMRTDASKRFEAGQSDILVRSGTDIAIGLYKEIFGEKIKIGVINRSGKSIESIQSEEIQITTTLQNINDTLGASYTDEEIQKTIKSYGWAFTFENIIDNKNIENNITSIYNKKINIEYIINIPLERVDLKIEVDIIEEIGRNIGYDTLISILPKITDQNGEIRHGKYNSQMYLEMALRNALSMRGYNEVITYTLTDNGQISLENSVGVKALRDNISDGLIQSYYKNINYAPLMQVDMIKSYEIGSVFQNGKDKNSSIEIRSLAILCDDNKKKSNFKNEVETLIQDIRKELFSEIDEKIKFIYNIKSEKPFIIEINLNDLLEQQIKYTKVEQNKIGGMIELDIDHKKQWRYKHISQYPIVTRDVSCFYPEYLSIESLLALIKKIVNIKAQNEQEKKEQNEQENLVKKYYLVDNFEKKLEDGTMKRSAAFRIVYQSDDRTLTDEEVNIEVDKIYKALQSAGCEMR